jgi:hypothetical protein
MNRKIIGKNLEWPLLAIDEAGKKHNEIAPKPVVLKALVGACQKVQELTTSNTSFVDFAYATEHLEFTSVIVTCAQFRVGYAHASHN